MKHRNRFMVHTRSGKRFPTLEEARAYAAQYHLRTGNIVAVTEIKPRGSK